MEALKLEPELQLTLHTVVGTKAQKLKQTK
jgi:hypothetical protein